MSEIPSEIPPEIPAANIHPIRLINNDDRRRSRLTVFFRNLLTLPHWVFLFLWGIPVLVVWIIAWFAGLILGRVPNALHNFLASYQRYSTRVSAFYLGLASPFPPFGSGGTYPVDLEIDPAAKQRRWGIFFRGLLGFPAMLLNYPLTYLLLMVWFFGWFASLILGRMPAPLENLGIFAMRWAAQTSAYIMLLTNRYPNGAES